MAEQVIRSELLGADRKILHHVGKEVGDGVVWVFGKFVFGDPRHEGKQETAARRSKRRHRQQSQKRKEAFKPDGWLKGQMYPTFVKNLFKPLVPNWIFKSEALWARSRKPTKR